jgi:hypothetical protein
MEGRCILFQGILVLSPRHFISFMLWFCVARCIAPPHSFSCLRRHLQPQRAGFAGTAKQVRKQSCSHILYDQGVANYERDLAQEQVGLSMMLSLHPTHVHLIVEAELALSRS